MHSSVVLLFGLLAVPFVAAQDFTRYCEECIRDSGSAGIYAHPYRCDSFIQCGINGLKFSATVMRCAPGLYFDANVISCNYASLINCTIECKMENSVKDVFTCDGYWECENGKRGSYMKCPTGSSFNETVGKCLADPDCPPKPENYTSRCQDTFRPSPYDPNGFQRLVGNLWVNQSCGAGTGYDHATCTCGKIISSNNKATCNLVNLHFDDNFKDSSKFSSYVNAVSTSIISVNGRKAAYFNGSSYIVVPSVSNNDFRQNLRLSFSFQLAPQSGRTNMALISNSDCNKDPTFSVHLEDVLPTSARLVAMFHLDNNGTSNKKLLMQNVNPEQWNDVVLVKTGEFMELTLNKIRQTVSAPGFIKRQSCALTLGKSNNLSKLVGYLDEVVLSKCS